MAKRNFPDRTIVIHNKEGYNLTGPKPPPVATKKTHSSGPVTVNLKKLDADEIDAPQPIGKNDIAQIRAHKGLKQTQLAHALNLPEKDIAELETGKALATPANKAMLGKVRQYLARCKTPPPTIPE